MEVDCLIADLPQELLQEILLYLPYDDISTTARLISRKFNETSKTMLNRGFQRCERYHSATLAYVKGRLPRRESERRNHPLSRHSDILTAVETRLSLLAMTYNKFLDVRLSCFIPGKVIDELLSILRLVNRSLIPCVVQPARPHELLQELRDISSMAMEHFDEHIAPTLRAESSSSACCSFDAGELSVLAGRRSICTPNIASAVAQLVTSARGPQSVPATPTPGTSLVAELRKMKKQLRESVTSITAQNATITGLKNAQAKLQRKCNEQAKGLVEQQRKLEEFTRKYDSSLAELRGEKRASSSRTDSEAPKRPRLQTEGEQNSIFTPATSPKRLRPRKNRI